jgi:hypothetical protein
MQVCDQDRILSVLTLSKTVACIYTISFNIKELALRIPARNLDITRINSFKAHWLVYVYALWLNFKEFCILATQYIYVFCMILKVSGHYFPKRH